MLAAHKVDCHFKRCNPVRPVLSPPLARYNIFGVDCSKYAQRVPTEKDLATRLMTCMLNNKFQDYAPIVK